MQRLGRFVQRLALVANGTSKQLNCASAKSFLPAASKFHSSPVWDYHKSDGPTKFIGNNRTIFPVQAPDEEKRPAYVCHVKANIKYSPKKMWYIASFVRGMSVDEAIKQLSFQNKKGSAAVKETILEAQQMAVERHNVEFKSNLWVAESFSNKGMVIKGIRRHARRRMGEVRYMYVHYFVRLEEGKPPENYYLPAPRSKDEMLADWKAQLRMRKVYNSL